MANPSQAPIQSGDRAPDFVVPAVHEDRTISLADYRGKTPLLLGLFRGLYCPFCRRALAQMAASSDHLRSLGIDSLAIVGTELDNARLYFKFFLGSNGTFVHVRCPNDQRALLLPESVGFIRKSV